jgi:hypothetical protein
VHPTPLMPRAGKDLVERAFQKPSGVSAVTLAVSMGKMKMGRRRPENRLRIGRSLPKRAAQTDAIPVQTSVQRDGGPAS